MSALEWPMRVWSLLFVLALPACGFQELPARPDGGAGEEPLPVAEPGTPDARPSGLFRLADGGTLQVETAVRESRRIRDVALHGGAAYYVVSEPMGLRRWSLAEGVTPLADGVARLAPEVVTDGASAYWMHQEGSVDGPPVLLRTPLAGGATVPLRADSGPSSSTSSNLVHHAGHLYFLGYQGPYTVPVTGGAYRQLSPLTGPYALAVDDGGAWVVTEDGLYQVPLAGGTPRRVASLPWGARVRALATSAAHVDLLVGTCNYGSPDVHLLRVLKAGGSPEVLGSGGGCSGPAAMDASHAYWLGAVHGWAGSTSLYRLPRAASGALQWLVTDLEPSEVLAVDESHVYWTNESGLRLLRVPKP